MVLPRIGGETHLVERNVEQVTLQAVLRPRLRFSQLSGDKMYIAEQQKWLDRQVLHGKMGTVLDAFYRYRHISSKTSSFGGTSAQPPGVAFFCLIYIATQHHGSSIDGVH
jgi:hypothetical protein